MRLGAFSYGATNAQEEKCHVYLTSEDLHRALKVAASQLGVTVTDLVSDILFELTFDIELVPAGVVEEEALKFLRALRQRRRQNGKR